MEHQDVGGQSPDLGQPLVPSGDRSIRYDVSPATSAQVTSIWLVETVVACGLPGASGAAGTAVTAMPEIVYWLRSP